MGGNNENDRVASPESVHIHFKRYSSFLKFSVHILS